MKLREQFEKETGTERSRRCDSFDYEYAYIEWLEQRNKEQVEALKGAYDALEIDMAQNKTLVELRIEEQLKKSGEL